MYLFSNLIHDSQVILQDEQGIRYATNDLMRYANDGVQIAFRLRPDFKLGNYTVGSVTYVATDEVPLPEAYQMLISDYVVYRAELRDDEYSQDGRAASLQNKFISDLVGPR